MSQKNEQKSIQSVGLVIPYKIGGSADANAQPLLLVPPGQSGPVPEDTAGPLMRKDRDAKYAKDDPRFEWYCIGKQEIAGVTFTLYGTHGGKQEGSARDFIDSELGDELKRATPEQATKIAARALADATQKMLNELVTRNPALANVPREQLLSMMLIGK